MSVDVSTYVMFGVLLPYDAADYEDCEPYFDDDKLNPRGNVTVLYDGMNGDYIAVGHVVAKTDDDQHFDEPIELPARPGRTWQKDVQTAIAELGAEPKAASWLVVSHYT